MLYSSHNILKNNIIYKGGSKMIWCKFRKIIAGALIGLGIGIILVLFLPPVAWIFIMGVAMFIGGIKFLLGK